MEYLETELESVQKKKKIDNFIRKFGVSDNFYDSFM